MRTNQLLAGNLATLVIATLAFLELLPWPIAGYLIIASVLIASLTYLNPSKGRTSSAQEPTVSSPLTRVQKERPEKLDEHIERQMAKQKTEPRHPKPSTVSAKTVLPRTVRPSTLPSKETPREQNGPETPTKIGEGDYLSFKLELEDGEEAAGEISSSGDVNVYVLTEDNLNALDLGQEFWYEAGSEGVRNAALRFTAPEDGEWFLVVENADNKEAFATVRVSVRRTSRSIPLLKTESLGLPDAKLEGKL